MSVNEAVSAERNNGHTAARHSDRCFVACSLEWDDVSLSSAATAIAASDCDITLAAITANVLTLLNATGARRDYQTILSGPAEGASLLRSAAERASLLRSAAERASLLRSAARSASTTHLACSKVRQGVIRMNPHLAFGSGLRRCEFRCLSSSAIRAPVD